MAFVERHGIVCESVRRGEIPSLADAIAGEAIRGNWWSHPRSQSIFTLTRAVRDAPQVLVCRLVDARISFVHERLWPALVRIADRWPRERLARITELHRADGKHVIEQLPFPDWVPATQIVQGRRMGEAVAIAALQLVSG